jgi:hypothetical protein
VFQTQCPKKPYGGRFALAIQLATLFLTGSMIWFFRIAPRLLRKSPGTVIVEALVFALAAWVWSAVISFALYFAIPEAERGDVLGRTLRTSAVAVWFAPATILLSRFSPGALAAALILVVGATRLLYSEWRLGAGPAEDAFPAAVPPFAAFTLPRPPLVREIAPALAVSFSFQAGAVAIAGHFPLLAAAWFALGTSMLTVFSMASGAYEPGSPRVLPRPVIGALSTVLLAVGLTVGGSPGVLFGGSGSGWFSEGGGGTGTGRPGVLESARALLRRLFYNEGPLEPGLAASQKTKARGMGGSPERPEIPGARGEDLPGEFPGVILWPEVKPVTTLIAPLRPAGRSLFAAEQRRPYTIPFGGEYWLYRFPSQRPPKRSHLQRGSPARLSFSTTDHWPLRMEARQKLEQAIDAHCCAKVRLEIRNADLYPGTISLELVLIDNDSPGAPSESLGAVGVQSVPDLHADPVVPVSENLEFAFHRPGALEAFDEMKVVFLRQYSRGDKSARIAIERFVLVP